ncbi:Protein-S-isoprenylcysteine O-methyltransferase B [Platanthera zijinensis]|uniref:Protein-S-isoprenylcysteine O-methyltransferase n=1 Tax=Platanthera zijinensis TaxID=2320716 RepID=A0AAP0B0B2_9ASPA
MELGYCRVQFLMFSAAVAFFHTSEYLLAVAIHGRSHVSWNSLLISRQYIIAMAFSMFEYYLEVVFLPELKAQWWITNIGLLMVLTGEAIRKAAILTAGSAFTHIIRVDHDDHHELITRGIYR